MCGFYCRFGLKGKIDLSVQVEVRFVNKNKNCVFLVCTVFRIALELKRCKNVMTDGK